MAPTRFANPPDLVGIVNTVVITPGPAVTVPRVTARPPVTCHVLWSDGVTCDVPGLALAWTRHAVLVCVRHPRHLLQHLAWLAACDVRRNG